MQSLPGPRETSPLVLAILHELLAKLCDLAATGRTGDIDLRRLPLTAADREQLASLLGRGEATIEINALGPSTIRETRFAGAWWVDHKSTTGDTVGETIEVALVPGLLPADASDARTAAVALAAVLNGLGPPPT